MDPIIASLIGLIVVGLATFSVTWMLHNLPGPFDVFHKVLRFCGIDPQPVWDDFEAVSYYVYEIKTPDRFITKLAKCPHCTGVWVAAVFMGIFSYAAGMGWMLGSLSWFGACGVVNILVEVLDVQSD